MRSLLPGQYPLIDVEGGKEERILLDIFLNFMVRYYCASPVIDTESQSVSGCRPNGTVLLPCYAAPYVNCSDSSSSNGVVFCKEETCRYV